LGVRTTGQVISFKPILFSQPPGEPPPPLSFSGTGQVSPYDHWRVFIQDSASPFPANGSVDSDNLIQTIALAFPSIVAGPPLPFDDDHPLPMRDAVDNRMKRARASGALLGTGGVFHGPDIVFSLVPNHGDFRLIAAPRSVRAAITQLNFGTWRPLVGHPNYGARAAAHALTEPALESTRSLRLAVPYTSGLGAGEEDHGYFNGLIPSPPDGPPLMQAPELAHRPDFPIKRSDVSDGRCRSQDGSIQRIPPCRISSGMIARRSVCRLSTRSSFGASRASRRWRRPNPS
jgi:hypothetical protein